MPRPPRGVEPELVSRFIKEELLAESPADAYAKTAEVLRYYERNDVIRHIQKALRGQERTAEDFCRSAYALQAISEVGSPQAAEQAAQYYDQKLVPHPEALNFLPLLIETLVVLAPSGSKDKLALRINREVNRRAPIENESEESMMAYDAIMEMQQDKLPRAVNMIETKKKLMELKPAESRPELINLYLGITPSNNWMQVWAGRMLRRQAMEGDPAPIHAVLAAEIDKADPEKVGKDSITDTIVNRSAQAILYLQGKLTKTQRERYEDTKLQAMNFLWDDLE